MEFLTAVTRLLPVLVTAITTSLRDAQWTKCATSDHDRERLVLYLSTTYQQGLANVTPLPLREAHESQVALTAVLFIEKEQHVLLILVILLLLLLKSRGIF